MTQTLRIGCFGSNGHTIHHKVASLSRATLTGLAGIDAPDLDAPRFDSLDELLSAECCDLVVLCSPRRDEQAGHTVQCLEAGCHVLAEKPLATTPDDLQAIRDASRRTGNRVIAMLDMLYMPAVAGMKQVIDSGVLGTIVHVYALKSYPYHDQRPQDRGIDGGIMQAGIHALSLVHFLTGQTMTTATAQDTLLGNPKRERSPGGLQMAANLGLQLSGGGLASVMVNYLNRRELGYHGNDQARVFGTRGMAEFVDGRSRRVLITEGGEPTTYPVAQPPTAYPQDIVDALLDDRPARITQELSEHCTAASIACTQSMSAQGTCQPVAPVVPG